MPSRHQGRRISDLARPGASNSQRRNAIALLAPCTLKISPDHGGDPPDLISSCKVMGFKISAVFDISQTDGDPLPEISTERVGHDADIYLQGDQRPESLQGAA